MDVTDVAGVVFSQQLAGALALGNDAIVRVTAFNSAAGVRLALTGRRLLADQRIVPFRHELTPTTNRVASVIDLQLGDGWLLNAQVSIVAGAPLVGQTYVIISLGSGTAVSFQELQTLAGGDLSAASRVSWPGSPLRGSLDGAGALRAIAGTTPAAGAEVSETVPTGARWEVLAIRFTFVASGVAGNRRPALTFDDGTGVYFTSTLNANIGAAGNVGISYAQGVPLVVDSTGTFNVGPIPIGNRLGAAHRIRTNTPAIDVGDQYGNVRYVVREWIEGA